MTWTRKPGTDRRIQRTERLLHDALGALIHEKPFDAIAVKEILERANVGRTTFYSHYRDKHELLVSGIHTLLLSRRSTHQAPRTAGVPRRDVLWFSRPMFEHVDQHRRTSGTRMEGGGRDVVHGHLRDAVAGMAADELQRYARRGDTAPGVPPELLAQHVAATFVLVLDWWVDSGSQLTASEVDEHYRALVQPVTDAWTAAAAEPPLRRPGDPPPGRAIPPSASPGPAPCGGER